MYGGFYHLDACVLIVDKDNAKEYSDCHTIALISHGSKVVLKFSKQDFNNDPCSLWTRELPNVQAGFRKGRHQLPTSTGS